MFLNTDNRIYIIELLNADRKSASSLGWALVKAAACTALNIKACDLHFEKGAHGKPYLKEYPNFHFNISHSKSAVAVAFGSVPVGVDIEALRQANLRVAKRFFSAQEKEYVKDSETFFYVWTRKEAFIKQTGEGLSRPLTSFNSLENRNIKTFLADGYVVSVCSENASDFKTEILTENDILNSIEILET